MKKSIGLITVSVFVLGMFFTSCSSPSERVENAKEKVADAEENLQETKEDYKKEMEEFKIFIAADIASNEKSIKELNARIAKQKSTVKAEYRKKVEELDRKNSALKMRIEGYQADNKTNWEKFKTEYSRDMEELGKAIKGFTVKGEE